MVEMPPPLGKLPDEMDAIKASMDSGLSPPDGAGHSSHGTAFTIFDYIGLGFILAPPGVMAEVVLKPEPIDWTRTPYFIPFFVIGGISIYIGRNWDRIKKNRSRFLVSLVDKWSHSYIVFAILFFILIVGISVLPIVIWPPVQSSQGISAVAPKADKAPKIETEIQTRVAPVAALSVDEVQFRNDLRKYVLSTIGELSDKFLKVSERLGVVDSNTRLYKDRETVEATGLLFDAAISARFMPAFNKLRADADHPIETMDVKTLVEDIKAYYFAYQDAKGLFRSALRLSGQNPNENDALSKWIDAESRAQHVFSDLNASASAKKWEMSGYFVSSEAQFKPYLNFQGGDIPVAK